ncbi:TPA: lytic transglycosylase domain-containing protein [Pseudomonas aeruginosa]|nr:lytic transglycosylase domain-containing protein [Pseudomonas aeruginosa]
MRAGATYIKLLLNHFEHDLELTLAGYNAGEGVVAKYRRAIPPYPETKKYIAKSMKLYIESQPNIRESHPIASTKAESTSTTESWKKAAQIIRLFISPANDPCI